MSLLLPSPLNEIASSRKHHTDTIVRPQRVESSPDLSAASSSKHPPSRASTSTTPSTTSYARSESTTRTCRDTLVAATRRAKDLTTRWRWMAGTTTLAAAVSARSCDLVSCGSKGVKMSGAHPDGRIRKMRISWYEWHLGTRRTLRSQIMRIAESLERKRNERSWVAKEGGPSESRRGGSTGLAILVCFLS